MSNTLVSKDTIPSKNFICDICGAVYHRKYNVKRHITKCHTSDSTSSNNRNRNIVCPFCKMEFTLFKVLDNHLTIVHNMKINEEQLSFPTKEEFLMWKENEEKASKSQYYSFSISRNKNGESVRAFLCTRSGKYKARFTDMGRKRAGPSKGSRKIGATCPSRMQVTFTKNVVNVLYYPNHSPHEKDFCHLTLASKDRELIADKIKAGVALDNILNEFKTNNTDTNPEKKHFITKKHLYNIMKKYNMTVTNQRNQQNESNVSLLYHEFVKLTDNPLLLFKKQGDVYPELKKEDMVIILMTEAQKQILLKSSFVVCIDSTYGTNKYEYQLTTLETVDEFGTTFPCSYCISNNMNENIMKVFLNSVKKKLKTSIHPLWFLSDYVPFYYNAWKNVMTEVKNHFICKWCMENRFKNDITLIKDKKLRNLVYTCLRSLLKAPHKSKYMSSFQSLLTTLLQKNLDGFYQNFISSYGNSPETWAVSHVNDENFLEATTMLESLHQLLIDAFLKSRKNQKMDQFILELLKIVRDLFLSRVTKSEDCLRRYYIERLGKFHERASEVKELSLVEDQEWHVQSSHSENLIHVIRAQLDSKCLCTLKCPFCDVCIHEFCCTCYNYEIFGDLCKHIHAVNIFYGDGLKNDQSSVDLISNELIEIEIASSDLQPISVNEIMCAKIEELFSVLGTKNWNEVPEDKVIKVTEHLNMVIDILNEDTNASDCS